ncbi:NAD-dependent epimerase/dehydratase family protein [Streptomyces iconiensis]|uniref:GDP-mannose 4,6-dehydratase n=1 Tax=Streptomyces iconiensis TaxID=1384038 RepID=A0ABT6ZWQ0_9ACTN|nr:NAD-dependent epimerase/dehydratase family protein [Streptomyces iconiensis]MDJ1132823.1 GDP-mannose 4,6-dehydratase [Streptomyces iconiensis]
MRWHKAMVTGGAGFLGSHLCERLLDEGTHVICLDDLSTGSLANVAPLRERPGFRFVRGDVTSAADLDRAAEDGGTLPGPFDLVLHFACPASPADYLRLPLETLETGSSGTRNALRLADSNGARFVLASTSEVYGDPLEHPQRETYWGNVNPVGPRSVYDEAKRFAEAMVTAYRSAHGTNAAIVRLFNTYGPRMRPEDGRAIPTFIGQALAGEPLTVAGDGTQTRSICFVDDTVEGTLQLAASTLPGPVNIGGDEETTVLALAERVAELAGSTSPVRFVGRPTDDPAVRRPDTSLAREQLGWEPVVGEKEGLARTIGWFAGAHPR